VNADEEAYLREFFQALEEGPLEPTDKRYVALYEDSALEQDDPIEILARNITYTAGDSVQLFSGFRGTGKSTELRRLRVTLQERGYRVFLADMSHYLNLSSRVDVSDFLMAVAGATGELVAEGNILATDPTKLGYWQRCIDFLTRTRIDLKELGVEAGIPGGKLNLKANLRSDPRFVRRLQDQMANHLGAFVEHIRQYFTELSNHLIAEDVAAPSKLVLLVDSVERIRGSSANAEEVQSSVETLFASHADKLRIPGYHVVYTVPPYLKVRYAGLGGEYGLGGVQVLPTLKVRVRGTDRPFPPGLDALERVVANRGDWGRLLGRRETLDRLSVTSGGHLRDLLRLVTDLIVRAKTLPVSNATVDRAIEQLRQEYLPIADADARWLMRISRTNRAELEELGSLPSLARFLDTHLVLCYRNGAEWYDLHPLIRDVVEDQVAHPGSAVLPP
jgi:hypothetical protein